MSTYNQVRDKIVKLLPEIMALEFGCKVRLEGQKGDYFVCGKTEKGIYGISELSPRAMSVLDNGETDGFPRIKYTVLGRDISLADVLRAIDSDWRKSLAREGISDSVTIGLRLLASWNLSLPLHLQSKQVLLFIDKNL